MYMYIYNDGDMIEPFLMVVRWESMAWKPSSSSLFTRSIVLVT